MKLSFIFGLALLLWQGVTLQAATVVTNIAAGADFSLFLESDGSLWATGTGDALGDGKNNPRTMMPEEIVSNGVAAISGGGDFTLFITTNGSLWAMGEGIYGELGDGTFNDTNKPEQIVPNNVIAISAGGTHSLYLKSDGTVWGMGANSEGQLGLLVYQTNLPTELPLTGVTAIAAGDEHSLFLKSDGSLWAVGMDDFGQLGDGEPTFSTNVPEIIVAGGVTAIAAGYDHSLFIEADGSLWGMGYNAQGQLGDGTFDSTNRPVEIVSSGVVAIAAAQYYSLFLKSDGSLWAMGTNNFGQLGDGTLKDTNSPEEIVPGGVMAISAAWGQSLFLKSDGSLWGMGDQYYGELGDGFPDNGFTNYSAVPELIVPSPHPVFTGVNVLSKTNVQITATCGLGGNYYVLAGTNILEPLNQWKSVQTNSVTARGSNNFTATLIHAVNSGAQQQFYILQSHNATNGGQLASRGPAFAKALSASRGRFPLPNPGRQGLGTGADTDLRFFTNKKFAIRKVGLGSEAIIVLLPRR